MNRSKLNLFWIMVLFFLSGCFSSASQPEFAGARLGMPKTEVEKIFDLKNCRAIPTDKADIYAGISGINCQHPHANIYEAELYFYQGNLYQAYYYFEGKLNDLSLAYNAIIGKFGAHLKPAVFGSSNEGTKAVSSCIARLGTREGCSTDVWIENGFGLALVNTYHERAVALIIQDASHHAEIKSKYAEWDKKQLSEGRNTASSLGF